jgi:CRP/FNR family cyclic AMP-dependent transcriptional regulator
MNENATALLIEDNESIRDMYATAFAGAGLKVYTASDGEEGIALALEHHPKVILVDIIMPGMNGHQVVTAIRKDAWGKTAHIIYLTNMSDAENVVIAHTQEPEEYIIKAQTDIKDVIKTVRTAMYAK